MGKKMKLPFLSKSNNNNHTTLARSSSWPWPSCHQPRTLSFRDKDNTNMFKTINSAFLDVDQTPDSSWFTNSSESAASFSTASDESRGESIENVIRGLRSERLFFEPGLGETSSILEEANAGGLPFKESLVLSMESRDPYVDFRKSMEEMVEAHGLKDWEDLEELLCWYLRVNGKSNHGYIVGAFVDLLVGFAFASTTSTATPCRCSCSHHRDSPSSPLSFYTSSSSDDFSSTACVSSLEAEEIVSRPCLSSLLEADDQKEISTKQEDVASSSS
ncbi:hypothetical protein ACOSP7_028835 [Xanthoceras sorbifolium]|uniref:Transcription repressor n=1 Tax=Xanthoceras sorbifolium TaxID=99658 RepID=A0ABQ8HCI0_9ROSI|nr:hypothetical protein JRO89_XS12G0120000 [Xanthoceras sorbifolium]